MSMVFITDVHDIHILVPCPLCALLQLHLSCSTLKHVKECAVTHLDVNANLLALVLRKTLTKRSNQGPFEPSIMNVRSANNDILANDILGYWLPYAKGGCESVRAHLCNA